VDEGGAGIGNIQSSGSSGSWCSGKSWSWVLKRSGEGGWERGLVHNDGWMWGEQWSKGEVWELVGRPVWWGELV
jgi:hypothetical protein